MHRLILGSVIAASLAACGGKSETEGEGAGDTTEVKLCDDHTTVDIPADQEHTRETGFAVSEQLMAQWREQNPGIEWEMAVRESHPRIPEPHDNRDVLADGQTEGVTYGRYTERDVLTWKREVSKSVLEGARVFHDAEELGSTIAVSCDMCHPDAANTHPETYPKFQTQLGRTVLLRDMINWCLQHPVRAEPLAADDPRMRAMEAYILAQRKGTELNYGKH